jgi:hypothetical protein
MQEEFIFFVLFDLAIQSLPRAATETQALIVFGCRTRFSIAASFKAH